MVFLLLMHQNLLNSENLMAVFCCGGSHRSLALAERMLFSISLDGSWAEGVLHRKAFSSKIITAIAEEHSDFCKAVVR